jgi:hypothetical protein
VSPAVNAFLLRRAKTKQGKDAGSAASGATEDAAMRRFAAGGADNRVCGQGR